jgi:hypothetical protein
MSGYRKTAPRFWKDEKIRQLDSLNKMVALYVFTGSRTGSGFTFSVGMAAGDTGLPIEAFAQRCRNVLSTKMGVGRAGRGNAVPGGSTTTPPIQTT